MNSPNKTRRRLLTAGGASVLGLVSIAVGSKEQQRSLTAPAIQKMSRNLDGKIRKGAVLLRSDGIAKCDGRNSDSGSINALFREMEEAGGGVIYAEAGDGQSQFYALDAPLILHEGLKVVGVGQSKASFINISDGRSNFWQHTVFSVGTYFGFNKPEGFRAEHAWPLRRIERGDKVVQLAVSADSLEFAIGDFIGIESTAKAGSSKYPRKSCINKVVAIQGDNIILEHGIADHYSADADCPVIRRQTGTLDSKIEGVNARMAHDCALRNLRLENTFGQALHLATYDCAFEDLDIRGFDGIGANPCGYTCFKNVCIQYLRRGLEIAYYHSHVQLKGMVVERNNDYRGKGMSYAVRFTETGSDVHLSNFRVVDNGFVAGKRQPSVVVGSPRAYLENGRITGGGGIGLAFGGSGKTRAEIKQDNRSRGAVAKSIVVDTPGTHGVVVYSDDVLLEQVEVKGVGKKFRKVWVKPNVSGFKTREASK